MPFPSRLSPHARGVLITFCGGVALSFDIPVLRLAHGDVWSVLAIRSLLIFLVAFTAHRLIKLIRGSVAPMIPGRMGMIVCALYGVSTVCFVLSVFNTSSANVAFILAFNPMFGALLSWMILGERPETATFLAMVAMTLGVLLIVGGGMESGHLFGDLMAALSALTIAAGLTLSRTSKEDFGFTSVISAIVPGALGAVMAAQHGVSIATPEWLLINGLVLSPFAYWALATGPRYLTAAETGMFYLLETVLAPVWVWMIFSERPPVPTLAGGAIILVALVWHSTHTMRREKIPLH